MEKKKSDSRPTLYYDDTNSDSRSAVLLLKLLNVDVDMEFVDLMHGGHLSDEYVQVNAVRIVPTLVHGDIVVSGHAILLYICENFSDGYAKQLLSTANYKRRVRIINRLFFDSKVMHRRHADLMMDLVTKTKSELDLEYHRQCINDIYDALEIYLETGPYIAGCMLTLADIAFVSTVGFMDLIFPMDDQPDRWMRTREWFRHMRAMPLYSIVYNGIEKQRKLIEEVGNFDFKAPTKRFSDSVRPSMVPRLSLNPTERGSVGGEGDVPTGIEDPLSAGSNRNIQQGSEVISTSLPEGWDGSGIILMGDKHFSNGRSSGTANEHAISVVTRSTSTHLIEEVGTVDKDDEKGLHSTSSVDDEKVEEKQIDTIDGEKTAGLFTLVDPNCSECKKANITLNIFLKSEKNTEKNRHDRGRVCCKRLKKPSPRPPTKRVAANTKQLQRSYYNASSQQRHPNERCCDTGCSGGYSYALGLGDMWLPQITTPHTCSINAIRCHCPRFHGGSSGSVCQHSSTSILRNSANSQVPKRKKKSVK